ncbi:hypothetical protein [Membranihabitans maritimus]|uniref:hypothetical protein n=1 Tax=Membranihabitans maritimus TaxID=2904244 RepID=UPI001F34F75A|nr:hypothetical protein [Membranihabitans maritimus]
MRYTIGSFNIIIFVFLISCTSDNEKSYKYKDLISYGIPVEIKAPDSVEVSSTDLGIQKDVSLQGDDGYNIQLFYSDAFRNQKAAVEDYREVIRINPYFKEFVQDDENGFIYSFQLDSTTVNYGFRYVQVKAGKEIIIQPGMLGVYSLDEARKLYGIASQIK